ncbi:MAG: hypothetical protein AAB069_01195, partial [Planctomycetota bacterium]
QRIIECHGGERNNHYDKQGCLSHHSINLGMNKHWQALSNLRPVWAGDCMPQGLFTPIASFVVKVLSLKHV